MADGILTPCNAACGSGIMTVNVPSGSRPTLQSDTWLWDDMSLNSPGGSTLQCGRWLWGDRPLNSPKRLPYWNSTSGFDFDHITAVDMSFCTSLRNVIQTGPPSTEKMMSCLGFYRSNNGFFEEPMYGRRHSLDTIALNCLVYEKIAFLHFGVKIQEPRIQEHYWTPKIQDGGYPPSWILGSNNGFFKKSIYDFI